MEAKTLKVIEVRQVVCQNCNRGFKTPVDSGRVLCAVCIEEMKLVELRLRVDGHVMVRRFE